MAKIAILDDRVDHRQTVMRSMQNALATSFPDWTCCECPVLPTTKGYVDWLLSHDVQVLLADQKLNERVAEVDQKPVRYKGHDVISAIRKRLPDFPIFIVTAAPSDDDLLGHMGEAENVITRTDFTAHVRSHLARMTRAGQRFAEANARKLERLSALAKKAAAGHAHKPEIEELKSLQQDMAIAVCTETVVERDRALGDLDTEIRRLETLCRKVEKTLGKKKR